MIEPSQTIRGRSVQSARPSLRPTVPMLAVPLFRRPQAIYARQRPRAAQGARARAATGTPGPASRPQALSGPAAAVFGPSAEGAGLNAADLNTVGQYAKYGVGPTPADTTGAIGHKQYKEIGNEQTVAYERTNLAAPVGPPVELSEFMVGGPILIPQIEYVADPQIKYDPQTDRWFYVALSSDEYNEGLDVGFSKSGDPTNLSTKPGGGWCGYTYKFKTFEDYPKLGLDAQHIIVGTNSIESVFNSKGALEEKFGTAHIFSLPKPTGTITECPLEAPTLTVFPSKGEPPLKTSLGTLAFTPTLGASVLTWPDWLLLGLPAMIEIRLEPKP